SPWQRPTLSSSGITCPSSLAGSDLLDLLELWVLLGVLRCLDVMSAMRALDSSGWGGQAVCGDRDRRQERGDSGTGVLKISLIGHRKRILASLGDRLHEDTPQKPLRAISLREPGGNHTPPQLSPSVGVPSVGVPSVGVPGGYAAGVPGGSLDGEWCEPITLRPPNEATSSTPVQYWQHHPEKLIFQSCDYEAYYLGSMLVKELRGTESTQDACAKMRKSTEQVKKVPTIVLSVSYKGVKFIDATNKAFEVAYQLALQARKTGHGSSTLPESFDSKGGKPVPKPRVNIRKAMEQPSMDQKGHANVPWIVEPNQEAKRGVNTKAMPDAHVYYCGMQRM
ncbi:hypothetical protein CRUP_026254, partial [Coryphaenoides rupestris]